MLEGLANAELRGDVLRMLPAGEEEQAWQRGLETVLRGWIARWADSSFAGTSEACRRRLDAEGCQRTPSGVPLVSASPTVPACGALRRSACRRAVVSAGPLRGR